MKIPLFLLLHKPSWGNAWMGVGRKEENRLEGKTKLANISKRISGTWIFEKLILLITVREQFRALSEHIIVILTLRSSRAQGIGCMLLMSKTVMPILPLDVYTSSWQIWLQSPWKYRRLSLHSSYTNFWAFFHLWLMVVFRVLLDNCLLPPNFVWKKKMIGACKDGVKWEREVKKFSKCRLLLGSILALYLHPSVQPSSRNHRNQHVCKRWYWTNLTRVLCWVLTKNINF